MTSRDFCYWLPVGGFIGDAVPLLYRTRKAAGAAHIGRDVTKIVRVTITITPDRQRKK